MKIVKKLIAVFIYLFLTSALLRFEIGRLVNIKQLLLVIAGTFIFYLPSYSHKHKERPIAIIHQMGKSAIMVSSIQTFVLLFILLQSTVTIDDLLYQIALSSRPLLYGFCIWIIFGDDDEKRAKISAKQEGTFGGTTAEEGYYRFLELGLTRREAEVATQICKGLSNGEIAGELSISEATVKKHISNIFDKLKISRREQVREKLWE